jgi:peptidoglycan/xylan/chitin deacetylase (PgdA/CDA1 family)
VSASDLTIVMYHYVRDMRTSRWPLKARHLDDFVGQLDHIAAKYTVVTAEAVIAACKGEERLPSNALWLTFDDGYLDHYATVFPLLRARGWQGSFFAPARAVTERSLLDVNMIHVILASQSDHSVVKQRLFALVREEPGLPAPETFWETHGQPTRFDPAETAFIKRMLQFALPEPQKARILGRLFAEFVSSDERAIADEFYVTKAQLREMVDAGMYVGCHGHDHFWLDKIGPAEQVVEVDRSLDFLRSVGAPSAAWIMCYPYGARNAALLDLLKTRDCAVGITTVPRVAHVGVDAPLELPRVDTNDLPCQVIA